MRIGFAGLNALYWPMTAGNYLKGKPGVEFLAAATLGASSMAIKDGLGITPDEFAAKYGVKIYEQAEDMITAEKLDTVMIVSRHSEHADWVERLAKLGVNMFIPKTYVTTLEQADRIAAAEKQYGVKIAVGPSARFLPPFMAVRQALDHGAIGRPFAVRICHHHGTIDVFNKNDWYRDAAEGGPELSLGWYGIDLILQLMGGSANSVYASYGTFTSLDSPFMDCGRLVMQMEQGGAASFDMYFCNHFNYPSWQLELVGPRGVISIHRTDSEPYKTVVAIDSAAGRTLLPLPEKSPHWEMFWVDELLEGRPLSITPEYARLVTQISLLARDSAAANTVIPLPHV